MDFNSNQFNEQNNNQQNNRSYYYNNMRTPVEPNRKLIMTSFILGIVAIATTFLMTIYIPLVVGGIAVMLAILSRKQDGIFDRRAKIGMRLAICAMVINLGILGFTTAYLMRNPDILREYGSMYNEVYEQLYGQSFDEMMDEYNSIMQQGQMPED